MKAAVKASPRLPDPIPDLVSGELVHYRRWCPTRYSWITDGVPMMVVDVLGEGVARILTEEGVVSIPTTLLKRAEDSFSFFASVV